jgi:phage shock protein C
MNDTYHKKGLYRSKNKRVSGVCAGIAEYFDLSVGWVRFLTLVAALMSGFWPVVVGYIVASLVMKPTPECPIETDEDREFYDSYANDPASAAERLRRRFEQLDNRIRRMEDRVTKRAYDWDQRLNS